MQGFFTKHINFVLLFLTIIACILHFYNLNWGAPYYFHPDERNILYSVTGLVFPVQLNPKFFAYGSLPIYTIYAISVLVNYISGLPRTYIFTPTDFTSVFTSSLLVARSISAVYSTVAVLLIYFIGKRLHSIQVGLLGMLLSVFSIGFIQFAHFGTFEMWLTLFFMLLFLSCLRQLANPGRKWRLISALLTGILVAVKISSLVIVPLPLCIILFQEVIMPLKKVPLWLRLVRAVRESILFLCVTSLVFVITNPFVFLDFKDFAASIGYESRVALGTEPVFYTGGFVHSIPILFQFVSIYPFLINPLNTLLFIPSVILFLWLMFKKKSAPYLLLFSFFVIIFFSQAFFYAKWTRYMMPTVPFMYMIISIVLLDVCAHMRQLYRFALFTLISGVCIVFAVSYLIAVLVEPDTRIQAAIFAKAHIPSNAHILSEVYDLGILPFNDYFSSITLFNFYNLDTFDPNSTPQRLTGILSTEDYIILPSQRIFKNRLLHKSNYPNGYRFYQALFSGNLGYSMMYQSPCDVFCEIIYLGSPVYRFEETANVFDRPSVFIFKRNEIPNI